MGFNFCVGRIERVAKCRVKAKKMLALEFSHCWDWNDVSIEIKGVARPFNASNYF